jgi:hypothetical protein
MGCIIYIDILWFNIMILNTYPVQVCSIEFSLSFCVMALLINIFYLGNIKFHQLNKKYNTQRGGGPQ